MDVRFPNRRWPSLMGLACAKKASASVHLLSKISFNLLTETLAQASFHLWASDAYTKALALAHRQFPFPQSFARRSLLSENGEKIAMFCVFTVLLHKDLVALLNFNTPG